MKRLETILACIVFLLCVSNVSAQKLKGLAVYGGCNFAVGDYGSVLVQDERIVGWGMQDPSPLGGAGIGGNAGVEYSYPMPVENLHLSASLDFFINGLGHSLKSYYETLEVNFSYKYDKYDRTDQYFMNVPLMLGANYTLPVGLDAFDLRFEAACGINFRFITNYYMYWNTFRHSYDSEEYREYYDNAVSFAYRMGVSMVFSNNLSFGVYYYGLGAASVKGDFEREVYHDSSTPVSETRKFLNGKINPAMLVLRMGYHF